MGVKKSIGGTDGIIPKSGSLNHITKRAMALDRTRILGIGIAIVAFFAYTAFPLMSPKLYNSPDDQANAFFIQRFAEHGELSYSEPMNLLVQGRIVPRSMRAIGDRVVPIGFPGLAIVFGIIAFVTSFSLVNVFTPLLVALSVAMLFFATQKKWGTRTALIATLAYASHPALWYYASRGLYPNAAVVALTVIGAILLRAEKRFAALAGMKCLAVAVFIRPVEVIWIAPILALSAFQMHKEGKSTEAKRMLVQVVGALAIGAVAVLMANRWVYGAWFSTGYSESLTAPDALTAVAPSIKSIAARLAKFGTLVFPLQAFAAIAAFILLWIKKSERKILIALIGIVALTVIPYAFFGARDLVGTGIPTIGTSFIRYWLPAFLIGAGVTAWALTKMKSNAIVSVIIVAYLATSGYAVWFGTADSLQPVVESLTRYAIIKQDVLALTRPDSIIIVEQADKVFFPDRKVVAWLRNPGTYEAIPAMLDQVPVYYFGITFPPADIETLMKEKLPKGVMMIRIQTFGEETLYRFTKEL
jgi:hypothetical protein